MHPGNRCGTWVPVLYILLYITVFYYSYCFTSITCGALGHKLKDGFLSLTMYEWGSADWLPVILDCLRGILNHLNVIIFYNGTPPFMSEDGIMHNWDDLPLWACTQRQAKMNFERPKCAIRVIICGNMVVKESFLLHFWKKIKIKLIWNISKSLPTPLKQGTERSVVFYLPGDKTSS